MDLKVQLGSCPNSDGKFTQEKLHKAKNEKGKKRRKKPQFPADVSLEKKEVVNEHETFFFIETSFLGSTFSL